MDWCNVLSVVGEKSGAGSREFRVMLYFMHKTLNISQPYETQGTQQNKCPKHGDLICPANPTKWETRNPQTCTQVTQNRKSQ